MQLAGTLLTHLSCAVYLQTEKKSKVGVTRCDERRNRDRKTVWFARSDPSKIFQ